MKKILSLILLLFISSTFFGQINVEEETFILKPSIAMNTVDINVIELNVIDINDIKTNNLIFNYYNLGPITIENILYAKYFNTLGNPLNAMYFDELGYELNSLYFNRIGINLNATYFNILGNSISTFYIDELGNELNSINMYVLIDPINVSEQWSLLYDNKIKPMLEYYEAKIDLLGENGIYYPNVMTYYGYWWIELQSRQDKEGMTDEIRKEWIKLFKEMKPYYIK